MLNLVLLVNPSPEPQWTPNFPLSANYAPLHVPYSILSPFPPSVSPPQVSLLYSMVLQGRLCLVSALPMAQPGPSATC